MPAFADDPFAQLAAPPVFVVGMHRSGTTWVYDMLCAHPEAAGVFESGLFSRDLGIARLLGGGHWYYRDPAALERDRQFFGAASRLNQLLGREELIRDLRALTGRWLSRALEPGDRYLVEKTPQHLWTMSLIAELFPGAAFVHVIRDGRDVGLSLQAAGRSWLSRRRRGHDYRATAARWAAGVSFARTEARRHDLRYTEVRYEDLRAGPGRELRRLLDFCRMPVSDDVVSAIIMETRLETRRQGAQDAFRRSGEVGGWRKRFNVLDRLRFDRAAGDLLVELGYERDRRWWLRRRR